MSFSIFQNNPYRDVVRVGVLQNKIAEIDTYTHLTPSDDDFLAYCCGGRFAKTPTSYITSQLQIISSLEDELDLELSKPIEHTDSTQVEFDAGNYRDYRLILNLQSRIDKLDKETEEEVSECLAKCCGPTAYLLPTNTMLTKQILERRLQRELRKESGGQYNYEAVSEPMIASSSSSNDRTNYDNVYHAPEENDHDGEELKPLHNINKNLHIKPAFLSIRFTTSDTFVPNPISLPTSTYNPIASEDSDDEEEAARIQRSKCQDGVVIDDLKKNIARLECDPKLENRFKKMGAAAFVYSIYNAVKMQDLKNKLRKELAKPINDQPPSYDQ